MKNFLYFLLLGALLIGFSSCPDDDVLMPVDEGEMDPPIVDLMPDIAFSAGPYYIGCAISLTATSVPGATIRINGSDGSNRTGAAHTLVFDSPGSYTYTVVATLNGRSEERHRTITVVEQETFSEVYQKDNVFTRMHRLLPLLGGGFVSYGDFCQSPSATGICNIIGYQVHWFNADGTLRTSRSFSNPTTNFRAQAITVTSDGNVVVAYQRYILNSDDPAEICLSKFGETGAIIWRANSPSSWHAIPKSIIEKSDGSFVVGGGFSRVTDRVDRSAMWFFSSTGTYQNVQLFGEQVHTSFISHLIQKGPDEILGLMAYEGQMKIVTSQSNSIADINASGYVAAGLLKLPSGASAIVTTNLGQVKVAHLLASGEMVSNEIINTPNTYLHDAVLLDSRNLLVCGMKKVNDVYSGYLAEITLDGEMVWEKRRTRAHSFLRGVQVTDDCGIFATGYTSRPDINNGENEGYYIKMKPEGEL